MERQLQLPLPPEDLYPQADRRSGTEIIEDNRVINNLMRGFGLTEEEAAKFYFTFIKPPKKGVSR